VNQRDVGNDEGDVDLHDTMHALRRRLARFPAHRYPIQHATAQFHLGVALLDCGRLDEAGRALQVAAEIFPADHLPAEHGRAVNALGAALRLSGRLSDAASAFRRAAAAFAASGDALEEGAAAFNLGLVARQLEDQAAAVEAFGRARELLDASAVPAEAAAAAREHGATLLAAGDLGPAGDALEHALDLASRAGDRRGVADALNALGLVRLGQGRFADAADAFRTAAGAHPRSIRPAEHAMAKANLAVACERAGDVVLARLAARQALAAPETPDAVAAQAGAVLQRLGDPAGDLVTALDDQPVDRWPALVREELLRWVDEAEDERRAEAAGWVAGQLARPAVATTVADAVLGALLELPPAAMETVVVATLEALAAMDAEDRARFRSQTSRAMAGFPLPQETRLRATFNAHAADHGGQPQWT
jgi:tetratricopeptide (TPR) repeat protein